ncbi:hypothetical protein DFJ74DRAFT_736837 [Hyaloraphidium curvatum]|nr:hypothetical protein DFJ74DRAFT_736837 [Hyaloraphidium curvatum]
MEELVIPGQLLGSAEELGPGRGAYERDGSVHASTIGLTRTLDSKGKSTVEVVSTKPAPLCPMVDLIVVGEVIRINPKFATLRIVEVTGTTVREDFEGIIRQQDVRATDKDRVQLHATYSLGDVVKARIISLGDKSCLLSTAEKDLGVILRGAMAAAK